MMIFEEDGLKVDVAETHPAFSAIRALILGRLAAEDGGPVASAPTLDEKVSAMRGSKVESELRRFWGECGENQREELIVLSERGELRQAELEAILRISPSRLRARHIGLSKICRRLSHKYPIESSGKSRGTRRFWLKPELAAVLLKIARPEN